MTKLRAPRDRRRKAPSHPSVMMLVTHGGATWPDAEMSRRALVCRYGDLPWCVVQGSQLVQQRNQLVAKLLDSEVEWGLLLDDDMVFEPDLLDRLLGVADPVERPVVAGLTVGWNPVERRVFPTMYAEGPDEGRLAMVTAWPPGEVVEVAATGAACVLVHRSVFEAVRDAGFSVERPWFDLGDNGRFGGTGEDLEFMRRVRACGFPVLVDTSVLVDHLKVVRLGVADYVAHLGKEASDGSAG